MTKSALKGQLSAWTVPILLRELRGERRTGLLSFELGETKRALRFREGQVVAAFTNVESEKLPARLLALGLVAETDLQQALTIMRRDVKALADVLEARGLVNRVGLERALSEQVRDILARAFGGDQGTYVFHDQAAPAGEESSLDIATEDLILEAVRQIADPAVVRYALGETDRTLVLGRGLRLERLRLTASDGYFLSRVDGTLTGREVIEVLPLESDEAQRTLSPSSARASWSSKGRSRFRSSSPTGRPARRSGGESGDWPLRLPRRRLRTSPPCLSYPWRRS